MEYCSGQLRICISLQVDECELHSRFLDLIYSTVHDIARMTTRIKHITR